ncbi:MAG TPA: hypothetical protein VGS97_22390 [Actinocrinis sp.]|uniref:hypothetical protein n=1 Tax=Actinocrinis sp. TaxID=1920516 RepID=UPI002DDCAD91|nr:hypothetical protein [Actinocrinis sp.]HEV2346868.1 hypothetical protein [Actinocrinis sp.]
MSDGTVKVTAEAHLHISQLNSSLGALNDLMNQIVAHGTALTDPNVWAGPAASIFSQQVWPQVQSQLGQLTGSLGSLQQQVMGTLNNITQAGSGLPLLGSLPLGSLPLSSLPINGL